MAEQRKPMRASERARDLVSRPASEHELRRRGLMLPELRLRTDTPTIEIDETTPAIQALARLGMEATETLALREPSGETTSIVLSVERYLQLAGKEINSAPRVGVSGRLVPVEAAFDRAHVEQADPNATGWTGQPPTTA